MSDRDLHETTHVIEGDLSTEEGCVLASVRLGEVLAEQLLIPVLEHTPPEMRARLMELFVCAVTGFGCSQFGPQEMTRILDAAKVGIADAVAARRKAH